MSFYNLPCISFYNLPKFISWQTDYKFVSESDSLKDRPTMSREEYKNHLLENENARQVVFLSLQDLKGSKYFGGVFDKLQWVTTIPWDVLVIDEAHEGVDTFKTDTAFEQIKRNFTLHLSGTPFKAIAKGRF
ncbi:MAG: DEAD/DEAH box helicase family protein, partial [Blautia wexlerae]